MELYIIGNQSEPVLLRKLIDYLEDNNYNNKHQTRSIPRDEAFIFVQTEYEFYYFSDKIFNDGLSRIILKNELDFKILLKEYLKISNKKH